MRRRKSPEATATGGHPVSRSGARLNEARRSRALHAKVTKSGRGYCAVPPSVGDPPSPEVQPGMTWS